MNTQINNKKLKLALIYILLVSFSISLSFAMGEGDRNLLLIGLMSFVSILLFIPFKGIKKKELWIYFLFFSMLCSGLRHLDSFRISTLLYSLMYLLSFLYFLRLIHAGIIQIEKYLNIIRAILIAYFITLLIQQVSVSIGVPYVFNKINSVVDTNTIKLNALSPEPSHSSRILTFLMYSYICMREVVLARSYNFKKDWNQDKLVWLSFLYPMFTMGSGAAFIFLPVFFLRFIKFKNLAYIIPFILFVGFVLSNIELTAADRAVRFSKAVVTFDENEIISADHSASFRVVPTILYLKMINLFELNTWFGYGIDYDVILFPTIIPGLKEGNGAGGIFPTFIMNYGFFSAIILFFIIKKFCLKKLLSFDSFLWVVLMSSVPFNTQLVWLSFMLMAANKYFYNRQILLYEDKNI